MKNHKPRTEAEARRLRGEIMEEIRPLLRYDGDLARFASWSGQGELCEKAWSYAFAKVGQSIEPLDDVYRSCECGNGVGSPECWCGAPIPVSLVDRDWFAAHHFTFSPHTTQQEADARRRAWREAWERRFTEAARICSDHGVDVDFFEAGGRPPVGVQA